MTFEQQVLGADHPLVLHGPQRQNRVKYTLPNGSEVVTGGMDKRDRILSTEYDIVYVQEATEVDRDDWETLNSRCRHGVAPYQQVIADCNPGPSQHWLKKRAEEGSLLMLASLHEDNPAMYDGDGNVTPYGEQYLLRLDNLTGVMYKRLRLGLWVSSEGVVYEGFDHNVHLIDRSACPPFVRMYRSVDFGFTNPFVCQWWGLDADGRLYLFREVYRTKRIVSEHAKRIAFLSEGESYASAPICDHDAEDRATLAKSLGIKATVSAWKPIKPGIEAVKARLRVAGDGKPRLYFCRDAVVGVDRDLDSAGEATCTLHEMEKYVWSKDVDGRSNKEVPMDADNHGMDAMRYCVAHVDKLRTAKRNQTPNRGFAIRRYAG